MNYYNEISSGYDNLHKEEQMKKLSIIKQEGIVQESDILLDVGCGTGFSLDYFSVKKAFGIDPAEKLVEKYSGSQDIQVASAENLPFEDNFFDAVVVSLVLCSVDSLEKTMAEIKRVLKPEGKLIMLEHTRSENKILGKLEDIFSDLHARLFQNCHLNRKPSVLAKKEGFRLVKEIKIPYFFGDIIFAILKKTKNSKAGD